MNYSLENQKDSGVFLYLFSAFSLGLQKKRWTYKRIDQLQVEMEENRKIPEMHDVAMLKS